MRYKKKIIKKNTIKKVFLYAQNQFQNLKKNEILSIFNNYGIDLEFPHFDQNNFFKDEQKVDFLVSMIIFLRTKPY